MNEQKKPRKRGKATISVTKDGIKLDSDSIKFEGDGTLVRTAADLTLGLFGRDEKTLGPEPELEPEKKGKKVIVASRGEQSDQA